MRQLILFIFVITYSSLIAQKKLLFGFIDVKKYKLEFAVNPYYNIVLPTHNFSYSKEKSNYNISADVKCLKKDSIKRRIFFFPTIGYKISTLSFHQERAIDPQSQYILKVDHKTRNYYAYFGINIRACLLRNKRLWLDLGCNINVLNNATDHITRDDYPPQTISTTNGIYFEYSLSVNYKTDISKKIVLFYGVNYKAPLLGKNNFYPGFYEPKLCLISVGPVIGITVK